MKRSSLSMNAHVVHAVADDASTVAIPTALALGALRVVSWGLVVGSVVYKLARRYIEAPLNGPLL